MIRKLSMALSFIVMSVCSCLAQSTEFSYQGRLTNASIAATANYDFEFRLYDASVAGTQQGMTLTKLNVPAASGIFTVTLDFGDQFRGQIRKAIRPMCGRSLTASMSAGFISIRARTP